MTSMPSPRVCDQGPKPKKPFPFSEAGIEREAVAGSGLP